MSAWVETPGPGYGPQKRVSRWDLALQTDVSCRRNDAPATRSGLRVPGCAPRYEHVGFGDQFEPEPLPPQALEEFHMPRRKTQRN